MDKRVVYSPHIYGPEVFRHHRFVRVMCCVRVYFGWVGMGCVTGFGGVGNVCIHDHMLSLNSPTRKPYKTRTPKQFHDSTFPENMLDIWDYQFSWIEKVRCVGLWVGGIRGLSIYQCPRVYICMGEWVRIGYWSFLSVPSCSSLQGTDDDEPAHACT